MQDVLQAGMQQLRSCAGVCVRMQAPNI
jgi:hypothetical protein